MAWSYRCAMDHMTLTADSKEQLAEQVMQHLREAHGTMISREEARESVEREARQAA